MAIRDVMEQPAVIERPADIGALLREQRLHKQIELRAVADALCIRPAQLRAIEEGRFSDLPGPAYAIGFIKAYAEFLGLDAPAVVSRYKAATTGTTENGASLHFPATSAEAKSPKGAMLIAGLLLAALAYGGWYVVTSEDSPVAELVEPLPDRFAALVGDDPAPEADTSAASPPASSSPVGSGPPSTTEAATVADRAAPATTPAPPTTSPAAQPAAESPSETSDAPEAAPEASASATAAGDPPAPPPLTAPVTVAATPPPAVSADTVRPAGRAERADLPHILLRAREDSWIQVSDRASDRVLLARLLRAGETYTVPERGDLTLVTGNAGGLEIVLDGDVLPSLGASGVVKRGIVLEADALRRRTSVLN